MRNLISYGSFLLVLFSFHAAADDKLCPDCDSIAGLTGQFSHLPYTPNNMAKGSDLSAKALTIMDHFDPKARLDVFPALVSLVAYENPFDPETAAADILATWIYENPTMKAPYEAALDKVAGTCQKQYLRMTVGEYQCNYDAKKNKTPESKNTCVDTYYFDIEGCLKGAGKTPGKPAKAASTNGGLAPCLTSVTCPTDNTHKIIKLPTAAHDYSHTRSISASTAPSPETDF